MVNTNQICPCGSRKKYQYCCGMYLSGKQFPETATQLMRSRYTAFCQGDIDYLIATHHPDKRRKNDRQQIANSIKNTTWLGLKIVDPSQGNKHDAISKRSATRGAQRLLSQTTQCLAESEIAYVEFIAVFKTDEVQQLHERSKFIKTDGKWFYLEGEILPNLIPKRNENCWCGSGKKYKKCHGN